ncbi:hypothetical protein Entcl_1849 [[Enterobacter] lignolyticus SCF1]|uniref:Uncharacterized protein n=1 Tax=Enterobacter lignolyticus (strain SCF1) TaxID=701347 RepID=E3G2S4_ENTLS|nr:hypothetical protein Entcl_1849 [[Enterobacter] lignolyticus SCF1]
MFPNGTETLENANQTMKGMREFYHSRMVATTSILLTISSFFVSIVALFVAIIALFVGGN